MSRTLFAVNQRTPLDALQRALRQTRGGATVLTSHRLFDYERARLGSGFELVEFGDVLTDSDLVACDERACEEAEADPAIDRAWRAAFLKNRTAHERLGVFDEIRFTPGLGIAGDYWRSRHGRELPASWRYRARELAWRLRNRWKAPPAMDHLVTHESGAVLFFGPVTRLGFAADRPVQVHALDPRSSIPEARRLAGQPVQFATTVHHAAAPRTRGRDVVVCSDGYHPPNYPRSYLADIAGRPLMPRDMFDREWFALASTRLVEPFPFLRTEHMRAPIACGIRTIVLALNHAGDWSALVNRSDTDRLVEAFCACAARFPSVAFRVRPHPTMTHPRHEGIDSIRRLAGFVQSRHLGNLRMSRCAMPEELEGGDLFVSEYSNVLLEAWKVGKAGVIANLTGRRDFMHCYRDLGFASADSVDALAREVGRALDDGAAFQRCQAAAVERYNAALDEFLGLSGRKNASTNAGDWH